MLLDERILNFYKHLSTDEVKLPQGVSVMNPYRGKYAKKVGHIMKLFYEKYYHDNLPRKMILGINPGRFGAGQTGLMFTDTIRLNENCRIPFHDFSSRELSSEFFYKVINQFGGTEKFYGTYYIGAVSPLGYVIQNSRGKEVNYNYYDSSELLKSIKPFIIKSLHQQLSFNIDRKVCYCLSTGKNYRFLSELNQELMIFDKIIPLEHPRYILQYKRKKSEYYIQKYLEEL